MSRTRPGPAAGPTSSSRRDGRDRAAGAAGPTPSSRRDGRDRAAGGDGHDRHRRRSLALLVAAAFVVALATFTLVTAARAGRHAIAAKGALLRAEEQLSARHLDAARAELTTAQVSLREMKADLDRMGPILPLSKLIPVVRSQVIAVETFQSAGSTLADAGLRLSDAAQKVLESSTGETPLSAALEKLRGINASLASGAESVQQAAAQVDSLQGRWLIGPIADARDELSARLPRYARQATSTEEGLNALVRFAGGDGPRRYLFLSQNPDEIRPTGGFIGTYGVMVASPGELSLERFEPIGRFRDRHPTATIPGAEAGSPFRFAVPPLAQTLANVNSLPDFTKAGKLAAQLWNGAGEPPVDGAISFAPAFLARILGVLGPVEVADYGETVDAGNLIERFTHYTEQLELDQDFDKTRKGFVSGLAEVVMQRLLEAPSSKWQALGEAVGKGFEAREAMAWSSDPEVATALENRRWDGTLPKATGDFFYNSEFAYAAKFDRGLQRTFDHHVQLRADGSARITTTMTITNTRAAGQLNHGSLSYVTIYGPSGAELAPASDPPNATEPAIAGHPAAGWFLNAPPLGKATLTVVWDVKDLLRKGAGGTRTYSLWWLRVPDHSGDVLNLRVDPPAGWQWKGDVPSARIDLNQDVKGTWVVAPAA